MTSVRREALLVGLGSLGLAVLMTWPTLRHPASTVPQDPFDPLLEAWAVAWGGHAVAHQPTHLFDANVFWPLTNSYAFTDSLLGYAPIAWLGAGPVAALVHYNVLYVLVAALAFAGAYALARQLGAHPIGALAAAAAFGYAPWRLAQAGHLHVLSTGAIPLSLAMLARGHGYGGDGLDTRRVRPGWAVAGWQLTIGFGVGLPFAYLLGLGLLAGVAGWLLAKRPWLPRRLVLADAAGLLLFIAVGLLMALPYLRVAHNHPEARRSPAAVALFSPPLRGFVIAPVTSRVWGDAQAGLRTGLPFPPETTLLPGFSLLALAALGLVVSAWSWRRRIALLAAVVIGTVLAMGTRFAGGGRWTYLVLLHHAPGWDGIRTPGRLVIFTTLALGLLAAGTVTRLAQIGGTGPRARARWTVTLLLLPLLMLGEGLGRTPHPVVPPPPVALRAARAPLLVLPSNGFSDNLVMYWSTDGFPRIVNGNSGFVPRQQAGLVARVRSFPDAASVDYLRGRGVRTVVLIRGWAPGTPWQQAADRPVSGLPLTRTDRGGTVVFTLDPPAGR